MLDNEKEEYCTRLEKNLELLEGRIKNKFCKLKEARKVEILKEDGKTKPLNIYCYEDKLMQDTLRCILKSVFEPYLCNEIISPVRGISTRFQWKCQYIIVFISKYRKKILY